MNACVSLCKSELVGQFLNSKTPFFEGPIIAFYLVAPRTGAAYSVESEASRSRHNVCPMLSPRRGHTIPAGLAVWLPPTCCSTACQKASVRSRFGDT
jgi:hypothetical protein